MIQRCLPGGQIKLARGGLNITGANSATARPELEQILRFQPQEHRLRSRRSPHLRSADLSGIHRGAAGDCGRVAVRGRVALVHEFPRAWPVCGGAMVCAGHAADVGGAAAVCGNARVLAGPNWGSGTAELTGHRARAAATRAAMQGIFFVGDDP